MLGATTSAVEIASFVNATGNRSIPKTAEAIEGLLWDMQHAGLVTDRSKSSGPEHAELHRYGLTEEGWTRARQLEAESSGEAGQ